MPRPIPTKANLALTALLTLAAAWQLYILPLWLLPHGAWWLLSLAPLALLANGHWFLTHEAFHFGLHPRREINDALGRWLAVLFGAPYDAVRFGHLMHHRFNGIIIDRPELYDPAETPGWAAWPAYYLQLFGGFYFQEMASYLLFIAGPGAMRAQLERMFDDRDPAQAEIKRLALKQLANPKAIRRGRLEAAGFAAMTALALWAYGPWWPALAAVFLARAALISFANNLPHYGTSARDVRYGLNLREPAWLRALHLNFYHHRSHHHDPSVPWIRLPAAHAAAGEQFDLTVWRAARAQLRGPVPAAVAGQWGATAGKEQLT